MNVLYFMVPTALFLGAGFVYAFVWAVQKGQFDDLETPAMRILDESDSQKNLLNKIQKERN